MVQSEFIDFYSAWNGVTKKDAKIEVERFMETYTECLKKYGTVKLKNFIIGEVIWIKGRLGHNFKTGELEPRKPYKQLRIKASEYFRMEVLDSNPKSKRRQKQLEDE